MNIPCYPCDKELFPGAQFSPESERESTTFYNDFKIAEPFGFNDVENTFRTSFENWKHSIKYLTELACVTNQLGWQHYNKNDSLSKFYFKAYQEVYDFVCKTDEEGNNIGPFTADEVGFFLNVID